MVKMISKNNTRLEDKILDKKIKEIANASRECDFKVQEDSGVCPHFAVDFLTCFIPSKRKYNLPDGVIKIRIADEFGKSFTSRIFPQDKRAKAMGHEIANLSYPIFCDKNHANGQLELLYNTIIGYEK